MSDVELGPLLQKWYGRVEELEQEAKRTEENQDSMADGMSAARERVRPKLERKTYEQCLSDVEDCENVDEILLVLAEWRDDVEERDKRILDRDKAFRNRIARYSLEQCISDLVDAMSGDTFPNCSQCGDQKMPTTDKRYSKGYRWQCPN